MLGKDIDRIILMNLDDRDLLYACRIDRKTYYEVCDDHFFHRRLQQKYPDTLKNKPEDINYKTWYLRTVFYVAKLKEQFNYDYTGENPRIQFLILQNKGNIPKQSKEDNILLQSAVYGQLSLFKFFASKGFDIHSSEDYYLTTASRYGRLNIVKYLIENNANIHTNNDWPLKFASENGHLEVVKYLVEHGANINASNNWSLASASENGHLEVVKYLVEQGANINEKMIDRAKMFKHKEIVDFLSDKINNCVEQLSISKANLNFH